MASSARSMHTVESHPASPFEKNKEAREGYLRLIAD
jgi:hypothetical protein